MPTNHRRELAKIRRFDQLVAYLRDEMGWPIGSTDFEDLVFDYTPEELGIDSKNAAKIQEIRRLRPLSTSQPWGIFFVKFEPKRLPVVALRRILSQVALKKRASANSAERQAWETDDLLFISNYGEGEERQISFAHFSQSDERTDLPTLKVLGWDNLDTPLHLDHVGDVLTERLAWPEDDADGDEWRRTWRSAFTLRHREVIETSKELSERLAELARAIRDRIQTALAIETEAGPLTKLMKAFQKSLVHDLDEDGFADMYAQTIAYGLLSSRITDPQKKTADDFAAHMRTNPFLKELMETFLHLGGRKGKAGGPGIDFDELGVTDVVELLDDANMEEVIRDFGDEKPEEDPVIHFYELFLQKYDAQKRMQRGVFYTPRPVVSFIIRSVDELLRDDFGLEDGLADTATWKEISERIEEIEVPEGTDPSQPFVQILDPATGTGTFLVEVIDLIHKRMTDKWRSEGNSTLEIRKLWNEYVPKHLLSRLHGYELMMAPYAIAHMKVGLKLYETGYRFESDDRARIYLTNSLEAPHDFSGTLEFAIPALAHESEAVNDVKRDHRFTVVIGNPPYANYSANLTEEARRIVDPYRSFAGQPIRVRNQLQFERNLQDDFVKFLAIGEQLVLDSGAGAMGHITNATMLASNSLRGMREHLAGSFDRLYELHLHGGTNEIGEAATNDENVFDISQAVAIHLFTRVAGEGAESISYADMYGRRVSKYARLCELTPTGVSWEHIHPDSTNFGFIPQDISGAEATFPLENCFSQFGAGIKTNRDAIAIGFSTTELLRSVREYDDSFSDSESAGEYVYPIQYRPFDYRYIFYHKDIVKSRSLPTMRHLAEGQNVGLVASSTWTTPERFSVSCSREMIEMKTGTHDRGTTLFPLYRYDSLLGEEASRKHNLSSEFLEMWRVATGRIICDEVFDNHCDDPERVFNWLYGLFHAPSYRGRYQATLAQGFPIVLFPGSSDLFVAVASLGERLRRLHLFESDPVQSSIGALQAANATVEKVSYSDETVWIDRASTHGFAGVSQEIWDYFVGGYRVCEKWLKDRQEKGGRNPRPGRVLTQEDVDHYLRIVAVIGETISILPEIDRAIEMHGGWPSAFALESSGTELRAAAEDSEDYGDT